MANGRQRGKTNGSSSEAASFREGDPMRPNATTQSLIGSVPVLFTVDHDCSAEPVSISPPLQTSHSLPSVNRSIDSLIDRSIDPSSPVSLQPVRLSPLNHDHAVVGITLMDFNGFLLDSNPALQQMLGYSADELKGNHCAHYTHPDDVAVDVALYQEILAGRRDHYQIEKRFLRKNGDIFWGQLTVSAVQDAKGELLFTFGLIEDITARKQTEETLRATEAKYRNILENSAEGIFQANAEGRFVSVNARLAELYGYETTEAVLQIPHIQQIYVLSGRWAELMVLLRQQGTVRGFESQVHCRDGTIRWVSESVRALYDAQQQVEGYEGTVEDITPQKRAEAELLKRDALLQGMAEAANCLLTNPELGEAIPEVLAILGRATATDRVYLFENHPHPESGEPAMSLRFEWVGSTVAPRRQHWQNQSYLGVGMRWYEAFAQGSVINSVVQDLSTDEQAVLSQDQILAILMVPIFVNDQLWGFLGFDDCHTHQPWNSSEESLSVAIAASIGAAMRRQHTEEQMRHQAFHDALTGLPNRVLFNYRLTQAIDHAHRTGEILAAMFLDLDRFKTINDTLGHAVGDRLLQYAAARLTSCLRAEDVLARWGGDEFTLLLPNLKSTRDIAKIAQRISDVLKPPFHLDNHALHISSSMGIALYPQDGHDPHTLLKHADTALHRVKAQGRNSYQFYDATSHRQSSERLTLESSLHQALERNEFEVYYQPQINIRTGHITQMEALIRWQHPQLGLVAPSKFIILAEENGMIVPIGEWVLRTACTQTKRWQMDGFPAMRIAVNLSARQFQQPDLVNRITQILRETGLDASCLELEITESVAMQDADFSTGLLRQLRAMGTRIAVDDFGTGYSSLAYLKKFPLHTLKIDRSFVQDLTDNADDAAIISAIVALAHGLNLGIVVEGVETEAQLEWLRSLHCSEMQGFLFSRPLTAERATALLAQELLTPESLTQESLTQQASSLRVER